jgi:hypothetical protein
MVNSILYYHYHYHYYYYLELAVLYNTLIKSNKPFVPFFRRRMFWLLIIGLIHLVFLWIGDILTLYALLGLVLIWFVNLNSKKLLIWAAVLIVLPVPNWLFISFFGWDFPSYFYDLNVQYNQSLGLPIYQWQGISMTDFLAYLENDNFLYFFKVNIGNSIIRFADILAKGRAFKVLGIFLIGLWAGRKILQEQAIIGSFGTDLIFEATFNTGIHGGYPLGSRSRITYMFNDSWINNPNGLSTSVDEIVIASGNAIMTSNTICKTLTINPGASLTIDANVSLTTTTTTLQSISTSYSSLITNGAIIGTVNYERFINASSNGNDLISPPLDGQSWSSFIGLASNESALLQNPSDVTMYAFAPFNKADDAYTNYTISITANLPSGTGYRAATNSGSVLIFTGTVPTSNVVVNIEYNASAVYKEWNLIGNPYPSYLNTNVFLNHEVVTGVNDYSLGEEDSQGIYGYNGISGGLAVVNLANASANPITPGQGFFMSADNAKVIPYDLTFTPSMQIPGTGDDFISERSTNILTYLRLKASTSITNYTTDIYFNTNASRGLDFGYDSKMFGSNQNFILYSHLVVGNVGTSIALQTLHVNDLSNTTIP